MGQISIEFTKHKAKVTITGTATDERSAWEDCVATAEKDFLLADMNNALHPNNPLRTAPEPSGEVSKTRRDVVHSKSKSKDKEEAECSECHGPLKPLTPEAAQELFGRPDLCNKCAKDMGIA